MSMTLHISRVSGLAAALLIGPLFPSVAAAQLAVSANDAKAVLVNGVNTVPPNPVDDTVTIIDLGVSPPKVVGELKAPSSVVGPPQNVAIAPDESIALISSNMKLDAADPKKLVPDNRVSVIDLKATPPAVIATLEAGLGGRHLDQSGRDARAHRQSQRRNGLDLHRLRQDADRRWKDRFRQSEIGPEQCRIFARRQDGAGVARRRSQDFHSIHRR